MRPRARVDTTFKVLEKNEPRETRTGKRVTEAVVGDDSGTVLMTLWEETIGEVDVGKTYTITNGYANLFRGSLRLTTGRMGSLEESEEEVGEVNTENNMSEKRYEDDRGFGRSYGERSSYGRRPYRRRF
ncbi:MAG: single-stranded DNA-binding protein [Candidatus Bathyarchaeota archaeon]|nr:single-stranded DNA-binding protein [Candidatus Bathyarchaeota archaeon]